MEQNPADLVPSNWASITLDDLNDQAAMQIRVDRKYIVSAVSASRALAQLPNTSAVLNMGGARDFAYDSVYFDTPDLASFRLAAYSRRNRYKVRTRTYCDSGDTFLEVKTEGARAVTVKERIPYKSVDRARLNDEGLKYVAQSLQGLTDRKATDFEPVLSTAYRRTTVFLPASADNPVASRMTIDTDLTWTPMSNIALGSNSEYCVNGCYTAAGMVIIETKSGSAPSIADKCLWRQGIRPSKISKFATGMAALNPSLPGNKWNRTIARCVQLKPMDAHTNRYQGRQSLIA